MTPSMLTVSRSDGRSYPSTPVVTSIEPRLSPAAANVSRHAFFWLPVASGQLGLKGSGGSSGTPGPVRVTSGLMKTRRVGALASGTLIVETQAQKGIDTVPRP